MSQHSSRWERLWHGPRPWWRLGLPLGGILMLLGGACGALAMVGVVEYTSSEEFCLSCHAMSANIAPAFVESPHYSNRTGVNATCADCHVPGPWLPKIARKVRATLVEVPAHIVGKIDTPEKFAAHQATMAQSVWDEMKANDSRECRSCHKRDRMKAELQSRWAARKHSAQWRERTGETCIDCHQGVAHPLPAASEG